MGHALNDQLQKGKAAIAAAFFFCVFSQSSMTFDSFCEDEGAFAGNAGSRFEAPEEGVHEDDDEQNGAERDPKAHVESPEGGGAEKFEPEHGPIHA